MPRLPKEYKAELYQAQRQKNLHNRMRDQLFPLRFDPKQKEPIPSASAEKFWGRFYVLCEIHSYMQALAVRWYNDIEWEQESPMSWDRYSTLHMSEGPGMINNPQIFCDMVTLDGGLVNLIDIQNCQQWWFLKNYEYRFDCAAMLGSLIISMHWYRDKGGSIRIPFNPFSFPQVNMSLGEGPWYPQEGWERTTEDDSLLLWEESALWLIPFADRQITHRIPVDVVIPS